MAEELQLALLGNLEIRRDGLPVTALRSNKAQALLCYLAVTGRPHLRPTLVGLLWGDMPEANARSNLRKALTYLRQAVGQHLSITRQAVAFDRERPYWLDVEAFEENASAGAVSATAASERVDIERLQDAIELYRGDFLEGFYVRGAPAFEEWALAQRVRLRELALQALYTLAVHHAHQGTEGYALGIDYTSRLLAMDPWREEAHRQLMLLLARSGQRGAALAHYQACRQSLAEGLGVEPGAETVALYKRIRDGRIGEVGRREAGHALPVSRGKTGDPDIAVALPSFLSAVSPGGGSSVPFVARDGELAQLDGHLEKALSGQGRVVFVTGEAGTGKTALVEEFARRAQARVADLVVAGGNCNAFTGVGDPYLPFREILAQLTGDVRSRWAAGALTSEGSRRLWNSIPHTVQSLVRTSPDLIRTFLTGPALADRAKSAAPDGALWLAQLEEHLARGEPGRASLNQVNLFEQYAILLASLARQSPLMLVLDDLQWADAGSAHLLFHIGRQLADTRILIVGIYRPSEVALGRDGEGHPLAPMVHEFTRRFGQIQVQLAQVGSQQFVEAYLDSEPNRLGATFREALYERTKAHALCTAEMLREMQERGDLVQDEAGHWVEGATVDWQSLPARVEGVIRQRIERLPAPLRETLKVASVQGEEFTAEIVARVRGVAELEIIGQLSGELDRRHRLVVSDGRQRTLPGGRRSSRYHFRHILFQDYLYNGLDEAERVYLHEAVGNALEQLYADRTEPIAIQLAHHFQAAARMDKTADYSLQAGDQARALYADTEARQHYAWALDALAQLPDTLANRRQRVDALTLHTISSWYADSPEELLARLAEAERLVQELRGPDDTPDGDRLRLVRIHVWMWRARYLLGQFRECVRYCQQALPVAKEAGDIELMATISRLIGMVKHMQGRYGEAEAVLQQVIPLVEQMGNWSEWFRALIFHGLDLAIAGDYARGLAEIQRAHASAQELHALTEIAQGHAVLATAYLHAGDLPRTMAAARQAAETAEQSGDRVLFYLGHLLQSRAAVRAGQYSVAVASMATVQAVRKELGNPLIHAHGVAAIDAEIAFGAGRVQEALTLAQHAVGVAQGISGIFYEGLARRTWGQALAALVPPQWDEAEAQLAQSLRLLEEGPARLEAARTQEAWGAVCRDRGDLARAQAHWEQAAIQWEASGLTRELERTRGLIDSLQSGL